MPSDENMPRRTFWERYWPILLIVLTFCYWLTTLYFDGIQQTRRTLKVGWDGSRLTFHVEEYGPYVVTHLIDGRYREIAQLPEPLVILTSNSAAIEWAKVKSLPWRAVESGERVPAPDKGFPIRAFYYRSDTTEWGDWSDGAQAAAPSKTP